MLLTTVALYGSIIIFLLSMLFHLLVILKVIPYRIVWGSRLKSDADMYKFESVSLILNSVFMLIVLVKVNYVFVNLPKGAITISLWIMCLLFAVNSIGNLFSKDRLEKIIFTPITILLTIFSIILANS